MPINLKTYKMGKFFGGWGLTSEEIESLNCSIAIKVIGIVLSNITTKITPNSVL